ncbi:unnamed protein product [Brugia pahangi]|uniref:PHM7_cyt domain-containing protein n=1 Tax=Brugia pahangi TaxID=6280 RepID=A0A0N4U090_BRUPA|nr:unnamed protein product [Brugia pahangi]
MSCPFKATSINNNKICIHMHTLKSSYQGLIVQTQSLSLPSTKSLQGTDEFQKNLSSIHKIRLLHDQATHYARLAQDAWEEARAIASSLNMPPPSLPDAVDLMTHNYLKYRKQWNSLKTVEERENITPNLSQAGNLENPVSLSRFQSRAFKYILQRPLSLSIIYGITSLIALFTSILEVFFKSIQSLT